MAIAKSPWNYWQTSSCAVICCTFYPERFVRIRYFGFLANRVRSQNLTCAREQLGAVPPQTAEPKQDSSSPKCPQCQIGFMIIIEWVDPRPIEGIDSS
jgi:hypothetical protein